MDKKTKNKMRAMTLAEAVHYLEDRNVKRSIFDLKKDIVAGKLSSQKTGERHWICETDLENLYGFVEEKLNGPGYQALRLQGWSKEEAIQKRLIHQYNGNEKKARRVAGCYEAHITMGTYKKQEEKNGDIQKFFTIIGERDGLVKLLAEKRSLGLIEDEKNICEKLKKKQIIACKVSETPLGLEIQLPITPEKQTEQGLYKNLNDFFFASHKFYEKMQESGIVPQITRKEGYIALACAGKRNNILNAIREYLENTQPAGFAEARLEARLFIPQEILHEEIKSESEKKAVQRKTESSEKARLYTPEEIRSTYHRGPHPQALGGLVNAGKIKPIMISGKRYYKIL